MPRCQHEAATVDIDLADKLIASAETISPLKTMQIRIAVTCSACRFVGVYRAYEGNEAAGDPQNWPKWLLRRVTVLRDQSPIIESACLDRSVPRLPANGDAE